MASLINIIIPLEIFFDEFNSLINKSAMHVYIETRAGKRVILKKISRREDFLLKADERYSSAYITSVEFLEERDGDIFEDDFCVHAIEIRGGRSTLDELENLSLRVISKKPDKSIKSFMNKLQNHLKKGDNYGLGVGEGQLYGSTFYNRSEILGKTLWFDFERKFQPLQIDYN